MTTGAASAGSSARSLLARAVEAVPPRLEDVALAIAADEYPDLRATDWHGRLDLLAPEGASSGDGGAGLRSICRHVYGELGFRGSEDYDDPRNNYLNEVIERRTGSPVLLAILLVALGRRAGVRLSPVGFPGHFLLRTEADDPIFVDPYDGGHPLDATRLRSLAQESLGCTEREAASRLQPVGPRAVAIRILQNLQRIYRERADHPRSVVVCDRLYEMTRAPFHRCDRGVHALAAGAVQLAVADLRAYLADCPEADDAATVRALLDKLSRLDFEPPS